MIRIEYPGPSADLRARRMLGRPCIEFFPEAVRDAERNGKHSVDWTLHLGENLLFDLRGLETLFTAIKSYRGDAEILDSGLLQDSPTA